MENPAAWWFYPVLYVGIFAAGFIAGLLWYRRKGDARVSSMVESWKADRNALRDRLDAYAERVSGKADAVAEKLDAEFEKVIGKFEK